MYLKNILTAFALLFAIGTQAQKYLYSKIPVQKRSGSLSLPWTGGMNTPQFSSVDLDEDGDDDLVVYDKSGDKLTAYLNDGSSTDTAMYHYAPQYEFIAPSDLFSWVIFRDFNRDGVPDIFTHTNSGIRVFKGYRNAGIITYELYSSLLKYNDGGFSVNIYTAIDDIPAIEDVDLDGDLDVLTFGVFGTTVEYYINQSLERGFGLDSLVFTTGDLCWGGFAENSTNNGVTLAACRGGGIAQPAPAGSRHVGSTILAYDMDDDRDLDLLLGDVAYSSMVKLINGGDSSFAVITSYDSVYPSCERSISMDIFPAAFKADVNNDGLDDLLIAPNTRAVARDIKNVAFYRGTGNSCPVAFASDSFLVGEMLDFGSDAKPVLFDYNFDGSLDLVIGNYGYYRPFTNVLSSLALYENRGTVTEPFFEERSSDLASISSYNLVAVHPAFGDLDNDGKQDLLLGEQFGMLHFFKNTGTTISNFNTMTTPNYFNLDVGQFSAPFIYDLNKDGLNDIVCGRKDGRLTYFWNFGSASNPQFSQDSSNSSFGQVNVTVPGFTEGNSTPFVYTDSTNGFDYLLVGSRRGAVFKYLVDTASLRSGPFPLVDTNFMRYRPGYNVCLSRADLNKDGYQDYIIGNSRGGIQFLSDTLLDTVVTVAIPSIQNASFRLYPNPAQNQLTIALNEKGIWNMIITDISGRVVQTLNIKEEIGQFDVSTLHPGLYILSGNNGQERIHMKFLKQ